MAKQKFILTENSINGTKLNDKIKDGKALHIGDVMQRAVEYYTFIDEVGVELYKICYEQIKPLLEEFKFDEAKKEVNKFYKPSNIDGHVIFIERDMIMAKINRLKSKHGA